MRSPNVFITDAQVKHALSAVRSLGQKGITVTAGSSVPYSQSFFSRYCRRRVLYPDPVHEDAFVSFMLDYVKKNRVDVLLPIGYLPTVAISKHKEEFERYTKVPVADYPALQIAADKLKSVRLAQQVGIPTPKTLEDGDTADAFPLVVKGVRNSKDVRYVNSPDEFDQKRRRDTIAQEYIPGRGFGLFALFNRGQPRAVFMHSRIREFPINGGPSTSAESIYDLHLKELGLLLLKSLRWHGVAMVEFKRDDRDGEYKLMEINPKFWGSLDLAIASGVDFPYLTVRMALDGDIPPVHVYRKGVRYQWPFPDDALHCIANPVSLPEYIGNLVDPHIDRNIWPDDIKPNIIQAATTPFILLYRLMRGNFRYPYGKVQAPRRTVL
jgi:predicted ATP-grasp superfamily ATP-dependent carboligase